LREKLIRNLDEVWKLEQSTRAPLYDGSGSGSVVGQRVGTVARKLVPASTSCHPASAPAPTTFITRRKEMFVILEARARCA